jgi:predicted ATPase
LRELLAGRVTFLFTDIEGSTRLLYELGDGYVHALGHHRRAIRTVCAAHRGVEVDTQGDAFFYAFGDPNAAVAAAAEVQRELADGPLRVRIGIHTGQALLFDEGYVGIDVHRAARIAACSNGGQVLISEQTCQLLSADAELRDLGRHRLKDLQAAEHIFQLGSADFPPLKSLHQTNLPVPATPFVGRERELAEVRSLIRAGALRLLTLTGAGGSGKTRIALQVAADSVDDYPDGVWFVSLAALTDPRLVLSTVALTLGLRESERDSWEEVLARHLRDKRLLLVVDNVEHLLPAAAAQLGKLLGVAARMDVLATSREPLRLAPEQEYPVAPLASVEAIAFFVERARAMRPGFKLTATTLSTVEAICARLDCLPLAVDLAVVWTKLLPLDTLLTRLEQRLPMLEAGARDAPERQRTLAATIAWSYGLLTGDEQRAFARLSVFSGGCTLETAEAVSEVGLDILASLLDKSLLRLEEAHDGEARYTMLETIREFARDRLTQCGEVDEMSQRHAGHFLSLAESAEPELKGPRQSSWLTRLEADHDNLRTSLRWTLDHGEADTALRLAGTLWLFWYMRGHVSEARRWLNEALHAAVPSATAARAKALNGAGYLAGEQGDPDAAVALMEESLRSAREAGSIADVSIAAAQLCAYTMDTDPAKAEALGHEAASLARSQGDRWTLAVALNNLGVIASNLGDTRRASTLFEESCQLRRDVGDASCLALSLTNIGEMALIAREWGRAKETLTESLRLAKEIGDKRHIAFALQTLGWVVLALSELDAADAYFREGLALATDVGHKGFEHVTLYGMAGLAAALDDPVRAAILAGCADTVGGLGKHQATALDAGIHAPLLEAARSRCDPGTWDAAVQEGRAMSGERAMAYALSRETRPVSA